MRIEAYKKAALRLHGCHPSDQKWLLSQLPEDQCRLLNSMLSELDELGIPKEPTMFSDAQEDSSALPQAISDNKASTQLPPAFVAVENAGLDELASVLDQESAVTVAVVLKAHDWTWRHDFIKNCLRKRRQMIMEAMDGDYTNVTETVRYTIIELIANRLQVDRAGDQPIESDGCGVRKSSRLWAFLRRLR